MTPKDILTNPYFCPMPWTGLMYNFDGKIKNCIRSVQELPIGNIQDLCIEEIVVGPENLCRQQTINDKNPVESCQTCYDIERNKKGFDIISDRIFYIKELKKVSPDVYIPGNFDLQAIDVRWSNLCNFACVYCSPTFSSRLAEERGTIINVPTDMQKEKFKNYIFENAYKLKHVYLAGGEPLLMKENLELLKRLNPDVNLRINTNLSKVDTSVFEMVCNFKNVHWTVSVESMLSEYEYIRYGGRWSEFLDNLKIIQALDHKISFNMLWFILNYNSIFECVEYLKSQGFHNNSFIIGALLTPEYLNIRHLPVDILNKLRKKLQDKIAENPGYLLEDSLRNMLHYMQIPMEKNLEESFKQLNILDQRRGLNSSKVFKDLYKLSKGY